MLDSLGIYSNRPGTESAESVITTAPDQNAPGAAPAAPPASPPSPAPESPPGPSPAPPQGAPEPKGDLISDLGKQFAKNIGEVSSTDASATPPAQRPEAPKPDEKDWRNQEPPPHVTKKVQDDWRTFKSKAQADIEARESRIRVLETELTDVKKIGPTSEAEIERLKTELANAQSIVERVAVERSPLFKSKILDQEDLVRARLGKVVAGTGLTEAETQTLMHGDLNARENILEHRPLTSLRKSQIADLLNRWDQVQEERAAITSHGRESMTEFFREQQAAEESRRAQFMRESVKIFEDQESLCTPKLEPYQRIEGNEDWNRNTVLLRQAARRIYDGSVDRQTLAQVAILAPAAVVYQKLFQGAQTRIAELETTVAKLRGVAPTVRDGRPDTATPGSPPPAPSPNGDFVKDLVNRFQKATGLQ